MSRTAFWLAAVMAVSWSTGGVAAAQEMGHGSTTPAPASHVLTPQHHILHHDHHDPHHLVLFDHLVPGHIVHVTGATFVFWSPYAFGYIAYGYTDYWWWPYVSAYWPATIRRLYYWPPRGVLPPVYPAEPYGYWGYAYWPFGYHVGPAWRTPATVGTLRYQMGPYLRSGAVRGSAYTAFALSVLRHQRAVPPRVMRVRPAWGQFGRGR